MEAETVRTSTNISADPVEKSNNADSPEISVIMGVYNQKSEKQLFAAVKSILRQSFRDFEFIIYDDGSDKEMAGFIKKLKGLDSRIILIGEEENHGLAFSLNQCIHRARGNYIARMDADDISLPERFQVQYDFLEKHPEYSWCGSNAIVFDEHGEWGKRVYPKRPQSRDYLRFSPFIHPSVMYRRQIFEGNIKYRVSDETLRCEDYELFMRLEQMGLKGYNIQQFLFKYREGRESLDRRKMKFRINEAKIRYKNFKKMGMLDLKGWMCVLRPIAGGLVPNRVLVAVKRRRERG